MQTNGAVGTLQRTPWTTRTSAVSASRQLEVANTSGWMAWTVRAHSDSLVDQLSKYAIEALRGRAEFEPISQTMVVRPRSIGRHDGATARSAHRSIYEKRKRSTHQTNTPRQLPIRTVYKERLTKRVGDISRQKAQAIGVLSNC